MCQTKFSPKNESFCISERELVVCASKRPFNDLQSLQDLVKFLQKHCTLDVLSLKYFKIQDRFFVFSMQTLVIFPCHVALSSRMRTYLNLYLFDSKPVKPGSYSIMRSRTCGIFS